jgi:hypothetical protein
MHAETPRLADKTIVFSKHEVFKVSCHGNTIILLRIFLQMKNLKISLLFTKLSIRQTYIC